MVRKKNKGTKLDVFSDRAARANAAIFDILAKESPKTIKQLLKRIKKYEGLEEIYYASLTKRLRCLKDDDYIKETKVGREAATYQLTYKAYLAMFLGSHSIQKILDKASEQKRALLLLALINSIQE